MRWWWWWKKATWEGWSRTVSCDGEPAPHLPQNRGKSSQRFWKYNVLGNIEKGNHPKDSGSYEILFFKAEESSDKEELEPPVCVLCVVLLAAKVDLRHLEAILSLRSTLSFHVPWHWIISQMLLQIWRQPEPCPCPASLPTAGWLWSPSQPEHQPLNYFYFLYASNSNFNGPLFYYYHTCTLLHSFILARWCLIFLPAYLLLPCQERQQFAAFKYSHEWHEYSVIYNLDPLLPKDQVLRVFVPGWLNCHQLLKSSTVEIFQRFEQLYAIFFVQMIYWKQEKRHYLFWKGSYQRKSSNISQDLTHLWMCVLINAKGEILTQCLVHLDVYLLFDVYASTSSLPRCSACWNFPKT